MKEYQIWLDDTKYCIVDEVDFEWAKQWKWHPTANSTGLKFYASRMTRERGTRKQVRVWMHKEILKRAKKRKSSPHCTIGDHNDGDSLNNRRHNLHWCTLSRNNTRHRHKHVLQAVARRYDADYDLYGK